MTAPVKNEESMAKIPEQIKAGDLTLNPFLLTNEEIARHRDFLFERAPANVIASPITTAVIKWTPELLNKIVILRFSKIKTRLTTRAIVNWLPDNNSAVMIHLPDFSLWVTRCYSADAEFVPLRAMREVDLQQLSYELDIEARCLKDYIKIHRALYC